jgi:hypothetical protein
MKKISLVVSCVLLLGVFLAGCGSEENNQQYNKEVDHPNWEHVMTQIIFVQMGQPSKYKEIAERTTMQEIVNEINEAKKEKVTGAHTKGWKYCITVRYADNTKEMFSVSGDSVNTGTMEYKVSKNLLKKLDKLYKSLKEDEYDYVAE